jgi:lysophospholipase L1-like esterase
MIKNLLVLFLSIFLILFISELLLHLVWQNPYKDSNKSSYVELRQQRSNINKKFDRNWLSKETPLVNFRTDSSGYILPSNQHLNPDYSIAFLGGSTTECSYVREDLRFPALVSKILKSNSGLNINTYNAGRSGNTSHDAVNLLLNKIVLDSPAIAVLMEATNDAGVLSINHSYNSRMGGDLTINDILRWFGLLFSSKIGLVALTREAFTNLQIRIGQRQGAPETSTGGQVIHSITPSDIKGFEARLKAFIGVAKAFKIHPVLMTQPLAESSNALTPDWASNSDQDKMNEAIKIVSIEEKVDLIDLAGYLKSNIPEYRSNPQSIFYDGMHVNDQGSKIYAEYIASKLDEIIRLLNHSR